MRALGLVGAVLLLGCPGEPGEGVFVCTMDNQCPPGWVCAAPYCYSERPDAGVRPDVPSVDPGATYTYVISTLYMPPTTSQRPGFNLDGIVGMTCDGTDYESSVTGASGVDNAFADVWSAIVMQTDYSTTSYDVRSSAYYDRGARVIGIELSGVNSLENDGSIRVRVLEVNLERTDTYRPSGTVFFAGTSQIIDGYLAPAGDSDRPLPIPFEQFDTDFFLSLTRVRIDANVSAMSLTNGQLGGAILLSDFPAFGTSMGVDGLLTVGVIQSLSLNDLTIDPLASCDAVSIGMNFAARAATFVD